MTRYYTHIDASTEIGRETILGVQQNGSEFGIGISSDVQIENINVLNSVGIATTVANYTLDVNGDINFNGTLNQNGSLFVASRWSAGIDSGIYRVDGSVGIGTTNSESRLTVDVIENKQSWVLKYGDTGIGVTEQYHSGVAFDGLGNIYASGADYDNGIPFVVKFDNDGSILWQRFFKHSSPDRLYKICEGVAVDKSDDSVYVSVISDDVVISSSLVKLNSSGSILWQKEIDGATNEYAYAYAIGIGTTGDVYVVGQTNSQGAGFNDSLLIKFNSSGTEQWQRTIGGVNSDYGYGVTVDSNDNVYVVGSTNFDAIIIKFNSSGTQQWQRTIGGVNGDYGYGVAVDSNDNVYVVGETISQGAGNYDAFIIKFNSSGTQQWQRTIGGVNGDYGYGVAVDSNDNVYITGYSINIPGVGIFIGSFDSSGNLRTQKQLYSSNGESQWYRWGHDLIDVYNDQLILGGYTSNTDPEYSSEGLLVKLPIPDLQLGNFDTFTLEDSNFTVTNSTLTVSNSSLTINSSSLQVTDATLSLITEPYDEGLTLIASSSSVISGTSSFNSTLGTSQRITTNSTSGTVSSIPYTIYGSVGTESTTPTVGNNDDGYWTLTLPFNIQFNGVTYNTIYVGTNSYITFGTGSSVYQNLSASIPENPKIMISSLDNSCQRIRYFTFGSAPERAYFVRYEGTNSTSGTLNSPNIVWEAVFYETSPSRIDITIEKNARYKPNISYVREIEYAKPYTLLVNGKSYLEKLNTNTINVDSINVDSISTNSSNMITVDKDIRIGTNNSNGVILTSPNGSKYRLIVDNSGVLSTVLVS